MLLTKEELKTLVGTEVIIVHKNGKQKGKLLFKAVNNFYYVQNRKGFVHFRLENVGDVRKGHMIFIK